MREFSKFWQALDLEQVIVTIVALLIAVPIASTPLVTEGLFAIGHAAERFFGYEGLYEYSAGASATFVIASLTPVFLFVALTGFASRLALTVKRWTDYQILKLSLRRLDARLYGSNSPYRVPPVEEGQTRCRVADELDPEQSLHDELKQELQQTMRLNEL